MQDSSHMKVVFLIKKLMTAADQLKLDLFSVEARLHSVQLFNKPCYFGNSLKHSHVQCEQKKMRKCTEHNTNLRKTTRGAKVDALP